MNGRTGSTAHCATHGKGLDALVPSLSEWFKDERFRGCAFINSVSELAGSLPEVLKISRRHKGDMLLAIAGLQPKSRQHDHDCQAIALAVDRAIVRAQCDEAPDAALRTPTRVLTLWGLAHPDQPPPMPQRRADHPRPQYDL